MCVKGLKFFLLSLALAAEAVCTAADFDPLEATLQENINHPAVQTRYQEAVAQAMTPLLRTLRNGGYSATTERRGEVVTVTISADELFRPNTAELNSRASAILTPLWDQIKRTEKYKVLIAVHSDDTGDTMYSDRLTEERANAVDEFFYVLNSNRDTDIILYGLGREDPVASNVSIANRRKNRRVEIFFIPTEQFINSVKRNR